MQELIQLAGSFHSPRELLDHAALAITGQDSLPAAARPTTIRAAMVRAQTGQQRLSQRSYLYPSSQSRKVLTLRRMRRMRPNKRIFIQASFSTAMVVQLPEAHDAPKLDRVWVVGPRNRGVFSVAPRAASLFRVIFTQGLGAVAYTPLPGDTRQIVIKRRLTTA